MKKINKSIAVIDSGGFTYVAKALVPYFEKVYYYNRWECSFPTIGAARLGEGIEGVTKILSIEEIYDDADIFFFPDIYFEPIASKLKMDGKKVWGSTGAEYLERDRNLFLERLADAGLPVPETDIVKGIDELIKYLADKKDLWIKISEYRGLCETWHFIDKRFSEQLINEITSKLGPFADDMEFQVQKPIETVLEYGTDGYLVNGKFPENCFFGFEQKGDSYFCKLEDSNKLPKGLQEVNNKFEAIMEAEDYTGSYSTEVRIDDKGVNLFTDITPRCGFPPSPLQFYMGNNWGEVIDGAVNGRMVRITSDYKFGVEVNLSSASKLWNPIYIDDKYKDNLMLLSYVVKDGINWRVPNDQLYEAGSKIGAVVACGNTLEEAIEEVTEAVNTVKAYELDFTNDLEEQCKKQIKELLKETNYKF